jgi:DNA-binding MarR family transcriptional regulator
MVYRERSLTAQVVRASYPVNDNGLIELPLAEYFPDRLGLVAMRVVREAEKQCLRSHDIGLAEWRILSLLSELEVTTAKTIGEVTDMHKTKVSRAVADLERRRLIGRKPNRNDLRESLLSLTETGRTLVAKIGPETRAFSRGLWNSLDDNEKALMESLLDKLSRSVSSSRG